MSDPNALPGLDKTTGYQTEFDLRPGDCVAGMKEMPDESVDIVVTSPPYNLGIGYKSYDDSLTSEDYLTWSATTRQGCRAKIKVRMTQSKGCISISLQGSRDTLA